MPLSPCVPYASCNVCNIFLTEVYPVYSFYSSCSNNFYAYNLYIGKELYHAFPFPLSSADGCLLNTDIAHKLSVLIFK